jgi:hypothetical protein
VTLNSSQVFATTTPRSSTTPLVAAGRVFQVMVDSAQEPLVVYTAGPFTDAPMV